MKAKTSKLLIVILVIVAISLIILKKVFPDIGSSPEPITSASNSAEVDSNAKALVDTPGAQDQHLKDLIYIESKKEEEKIDSTINAK